MDLTKHLAVITQIRQERDHSEAVYAEYRRLRDLMFTAPTEAEREAALAALRVLPGAGEGSV